LIYKNTNTTESDQLLYQDDDFKVLSNNLTNNLVFYYIGVLNKTQNDMKFTNNAKLYMELALIKMVDYIEKQEIIVADQFEDLKTEIRQLKIDLENIESQSQVRIEEKFTPEPVVEIEQEIQPENTTEDDETSVFEAVEEETEQETPLDDPIVEVEEDKELDSEEMEMTPDTVSVFDDSEEEPEEPEETDDSEEEPETTDLFSIAEPEQEESNGFVEEVGIRSTRMRTLEGRVITLPNAKFSENAVENVSAEPTRKVITNLGLTYETQPAKMQEAINLLKEIASNNPGVDEGTIVSFNSWGDFSMGILFIYFIKPEADILGVQTEINMEILTQFNEAGLDFAYPTQTIYRK
jgi:DNA polymerase III gamma/tau subunit